MRRMMRLLFIVSASIVLCTACCLLGVCWYSGIWTRQQYVVHREMSRECHPVWRDLWHGRVAPGDKLDKLFLRTQPERVEQYGRFTKVRYQGGFTALGMIAKNGRLVRAGAASCTWQHTFFDVMTEDDKTELDLAWHDHWDPIFHQKNVDHAKTVSTSAGALIALMASPFGTTHILVTAGMMSE
jgi:hypothetical protein